MRRSNFPPAPVLPDSRLLPTGLDFLRLQAARRPHVGGLVFRDHQIPYGALHGAAEQTAHALARLGIGRGTHVAVLAGNEPALVGLMYAVWALGGTVVPLAPRLRATEIVSLVGAARVAVVLASARHADLAREAAVVAGLPAYVVEPTTDPQRPQRLHRGHPPRARPSRPPRHQDVAVIAYTSGTTGIAKGVVLTHANLFWAALACSAARGDAGDTVGACISPLTHVPVFVSHLLCRILHGSTAVLLEKFSVPAVLQALEQHAITDLPLIAGMVFDVAAQGRVPARVRRSLRKVSVGGAATTMAAKEALAKVFPGAEIIEAYGQSETTDGLTMARGTSVFDRPGTVGRANPYVVLRVRRQDGSIADVEEEGELVAAGPTVMRGYYRDRAATGRICVDGWLRTGDRGRCDADGYVYVTGRAKEIIITGGENVAPAEVEDVLRRHPRIADVAVIGTPHPRWGEQVTAVVVARDGADIDQASLRSFAARQLAGFKVPRRIELVDRLPRNAANKVMTEELKRQLG